MREAFPAGRKLATAAKSMTNPSQMKALVRESEYVVRGLHFQIWYCSQPFPL
jgi:hypothetical protein